MFVSSLNLVAAGGGLIAGSVSDTLGRKRSIAAACLVFITGSIIKISAQSFGCVMYDMMRFDMITLWYDEERRFFCIWSSEPTLPREIRYCAGCFQ